MKNPTNSFTNDRLQPLWPGGATFALALAANQSLAAGTVLGQISAAARSESQTISAAGSPTGGAFTLAFTGYQSTSIPYNATASQVQAALEAIPIIGTGGVACSGGPLPGGSVTVTFAGKLANQPQPLLVAQAGLTGGTNPSVAIARSAVGVAHGKWTAYNSALSNGAEIARAILAIDSSSDPGGMITFGASATGGPHGETYGATPAYYTGVFDVAALTGLDANAISQLGRLLYGDASTGALKLA